MDDQVKQFTEEKKAELWGILISTGQGGYKPLGKLMDLCGFEEERVLIDKNITKIVEEAVANVVAGNRVPPDNLQPLP